MPVFMGGRVSYLDWDLITGHGEWGEEKRVGAISGARVLELALETESRAVSCLFLNAAANSSHNAKKKVCGCRKCAAAESVRLQKVCP